MSPNLLSAHMLLQHSWKCRNRSSLRSWNKNTQPTNFKQQECQSLAVFCLICLLFDCKYHDEMVFVYYNIIFCFHDTKKHGKKGGCFLWKKKFHFRCLNLWLYFLFSFFLLTFCLVCRRFQLHWIEGEGEKYLIFYLITLLSKCIMGFHLKMPLWTCYYFLCLSS